ncbi:MAG: hypothetical protein GX442_01640 [Candidatus Riflebacteria bacterium]|nr:hypothetical protein [Candidatus Riflebacteria bacterium]
MKPSSILLLLLALAVVAVGIDFTLTTLARASAPPAPSLAPALATAPVRLYGRIEPRQREVWLGPLDSGRVTGLLVQEGQTISTGQPLLELEADVERQAVLLADRRVVELEARLALLLDELGRREALAPHGSEPGRLFLQVPVRRVKEREAQLALALDDLKRKEPLSRAGAVTDRDYTQSALKADQIRRQIDTARAEAELDFRQKGLQAELVRRQIEVARAEAELKRVELARRTLVSPIAGLVYQLDVRPGEFLTPQDHQRIVLGDPQRQVRLYVESFWHGSVRVGDRFTVRDAETLERLGEGRTVSVSPYVGARGFRTEDSLERLDTKYGQAVLSLDLASPAPPPPLGKLVLCERTP